MLLVYKIHSIKGISFTFQPIFSFCPGSPKHKIETALYKSISNTQAVVTSELSFCLFELAILLCLYYCTSNDVRYQLELYPRKKLPKRGEG
jgi:hypothetical protein